MAGRPHCVHALNLVEIRSYLWPHGPAGVVRRQRRPWRAAANSMKIVNVMQCTNLGGMERASFLQMRGLKARGHAVEAISLNPLGPLAPMLAEAGIPAVGLEYLGKAGWRSHGKVRAQLKSSGGDILLMTGHHFLTTMAIRSAKARRKILSIHFHHSGVKSSWQWRAYYRLAYNTFNAVTFPSDFVRAEAEAAYPPLAAISQTMRNPIESFGIRTEEDKRVARRALGLPEGSFIIGNAGWLIPRKRFDVFLNVAARIAQSVPSAVVAVAGDGPERKRLGGMAQALGIADRVRWLGWLRNTSEFYNALDVCLFNSDWDAFPTTPLEAMAHGVPVVASVTHGGLREVMTTPDVGLLLSEHDVDRLAHHVLEIIETKLPDGYRGYERVAELCSPEAQLAAFERVVVGCE